MRYAVLVLLVLLALTSVVFAEESGQQVVIEGFSFKPATLTIAVGTKVTWINQDQVPHTVVSNNQLFSSPELHANESFSFTFSEPGNYAYFCSIHPSMKGIIVVQPAKN